MNDAHIEVGHSISVLRAPESVVSIVRHFVAYQETKLPPVPVQMALRGFYGEPGNGRTGGRGDVYAAFKSAEVQAAAATTGFDISTLDVRMVEAACRGPGFWDGWKRLVTPSGKFPTGLLDHVERILRFRCGSEHVIVRDTRGTPAAPRRVLATPPLYPFQREAVDAFLASGQGVIDLPPRSGKTRIAVAIVAETGFPTLFVASNKGLARQTAEVFAGFFGEHTVALLVGGTQGSRTRRRLPSQLVWVATPQTAAALPGIESRMLLVLDEFHHCFSPETRVSTRSGSVPISAIHAGDEVQSCTEDGEICYRPVVNVWTRAPPERMLRIKTTFGTMDVTDEHRIYTPEGLRRAADLRPGDAVRGQRSSGAGAAPAEGRDCDVCVVRRADGCVGDTRARNGSTRTGLLFRRMLRAVGPGVIERADGVNKPGPRLGADVAPQRRADDGGTERHHSRDSEGDQRRPDAPVGRSSGGEREASDRERTARVRGIVASWVCAERNRLDGSAVPGPARGGCPNSLQDRRGVRGAQDSSRGRRPVAPGAGAAGHEERPVADGARLACLADSSAPAGWGDCVALGRVLAVEDISTRCPTVHDIEVAEHHRYFAEGNLVSNSAAATWRAVAGRCVGAWWRLGLTGTHFRADGRDMEMAGVLGRKLYSRTATDMVQLGRVVPAHVAMLRVGGPRVVGQGWYRDGIVASDNRNRTLVWAANQLVAAGKRVLCLVKQVDHGQAIVAHIPGAVFVSGESGEKTDEALLRLGRREVTAVVGTSVIGEGRDVPAADALVYFAAGKSEVRHTQDYYRVLTASPGKRFGIVVDAADTHSDVLLGHSAERLQHYREEGCFTSTVMDWGAFPAWLTKVA